MELSYSHLFDFVRKERTSQELQELPHEFPEACESLLTLLTSAVAAAPIGEDDTKQLQLVNTRKLFRELYDRREQKIVLLAQNRARTGSAMQDSPNLLPSERALFEQIVAVLAEARTGQLTTTIERTHLRRVTVETQVTERTVRPEPKAQPQSLPPIRDAVVESDASIAMDESAATDEETVSLETTIIEEPPVTVRITKSVPEFYGRNMEVFGPFEPNEEHELPEPVAMLLVRKGSAERESGEPRE
jgi:DNA replication initiation complex subunit (GINS family)